MLSHRLPSILLLLCYFIFAFSFLTSVALARDDVTDVLDDLHHIILQTDDLWIKAATRRPATCTGFTHLNEGLHKLMELMDDACRRLDDTKVIDEEEEGAEEEGVKMIVTPNEEITLEFREFAREIIGLLSTLLRIGAGGPYNCAFYGSRKDFRQGMRKFQKAVPKFLDAILHFDDLHNEMRYLKGIIEHTLGLAWDAFAQW